MIQLYLWLLFQILVCAVIIITAVKVDRKSKKHFNDIFNNKN